MARVQGRGPRAPRRPVATPRGAVRGRGPLDPRDPLSCGPSPAEEATDAGPAAVKTRRRREAGMPILAGMPACPSHSFGDRAPRGGPRELRPTRDDGPGRLDRARLLAGHDGSRVGIAPPAASEVRTLGRSTPASADALRALRGPGGARVAGSFPTPRAAPGVPPALSPGCSARRPPPVDRAACGGQGHGVGRASGRSRDGPAAGHPHCDGGWIPSWPAVVLAGTATGGVDRPSPGRAGGRRRS